MDKMTEIYGQNNGDNCSWSTPYLLLYGQLEFFYNLNLNMVTKLWNLKFEIWIVAYLKFFIIILSDRQRLRGHARVFRFFGFMVNEVFWVVMVKFELGHKPLYCGMIQMNNFSWIWIDFDFMLGNGNLLWNDSNKFSVEFELILTFCFVIGIKLNSRGT